MRSAALVMILAVFAAPLAADEIPTRLPEEKDAGTVEKVVGQLTRIGLPRPVATAHAKLLPDAALAHYAHAPEALQFVGQTGPQAGEDIFSGQSYNLWYESVIGVIFLGAAAGTIFIQTWGQQDK